MKLLFLENRYKTFFFDALANQLSKKGHEIHFIIQNKEFLPKGNFINHIIKYPSNINYTFNTDPEVEGVIKSDRQLNHFKKEDSTYFYYYNDKISEIIDRVAPDLVFGESTAFHELLTINNCRNRNILYLNPSTCRYPIGRFSFYKYDTLEPYLGSNELLSNNEAETIIDEIVNRKTAPDYMKPVPVSKTKKINDKLKKTIAYYKGETYNTPNPFIKQKLEKLKNKTIKNWDTNAEKKVIRGNSFNVLYPLQMQPEANIDVWGKKYRNQTELVQNIAKALPEDTVLYVKPNPKSKYELTQELLNVIKQSKNIKHLHHSTKMDAILPNIDLVITVTGTIAIECILSNKPVATLKKTINNTAKNCKYIQSLSEQLPKVILEIKNKDFKTLTNQEKISYINLLNKTSYKGIISDPFSNINCLNENNLANLLKAFNHILNYKNDYKAI